MSRKLEYPVAATCLAMELGMPIDEYMSGCIDKNGNTLLFLRDSTSDADLKAFDELWEERKNARK